MKFIALISWTDQGVKAAKESPQRLDKARDMAHGLGIKIEQAFLTLGDMDMVCIVDAPSDEAYAKFQLKLAAGGSVRTRSIKAFAEADYRGIMAAL
ncbi:GYD domain-containing protein [Alsobacter sp. SYSU M60028]|uniref:GYD domain-containing protein n=1 Tax=Alsobacter ponti TaxID=2962936 RepID=A0ABT1LHA5_9HYPH|nr:GYD domain-containing protein [Alsobacter ponti]MCP8940891.1 GYD domain-containing protein [Alsobacter ponti]